jgi:hypothetical protein
MRILEGLKNRPNSYKMSSTTAGTPGGSYRMSSTTEFTSLLSPRSSSADAFGSANGTNAAHVASLLLRRRKESVSNSTSTSPVPTSASSSNDSADINEGAVNIDFDPSTPRYNFIILFEYFKLLSVFP